LTVSFYGLIRSPSFRIFWELGREPREDVGVAR